MAWTARPLPRPASCCRPSCRASRRGTSSPLTLASNPFPPRLLLSPAGRLISPRRSFWDETSSAGPSSPRPSATPQWLGRPAPASATNLSADRPRQSPSAPAARLVVHPPPRHRMVHRSDRFDPLITVWFVAFDPPEAECEKKMVENNRIFWLPPTSPRPITTSSVTYFLPNPSPNIAH